MTPLLILGIFLLAFWVFGVWQQETWAAFMQSWRHIPLIFAIILLLMAAIAAIVH